MNATQKRCFAVSVGFHVSLLLLLVLTPALSTRRPPPDGPEIIMLPSDFTVTDGATQGAGPAQTSPPKPLRAQPAAPSPEQTRDSVPESKPTVKPPEAEKAVEKPKPNRMARLFDELVHHTTTAPAKPEETPDGEKVKHHKPDNTKPEQESSDKPPKTIKLAADVKHQKTEDDAAARKEEAEKAARKREAAEMERNAQAARAARSEAISKLQHALTGAEGAIKNSTAGTEITMPGPGRQAFVSYFDYLRAFYKANWKKPAAIAQAEASVGAEITVLRDGTLKEYKILEPSGVKELDDSVREVLRKFRALRPLPAESTDSERSFSIRFTLTADSST